MRTKHARLIREGIKQARQFEVIEDPVRRVKLVYDWARSMYAYEQILQHESAYQICRAMIAYTERQISK